MKRFRPIRKFIFLFFILALSGCGATDDNLLVTHAPIPTPSTLEDMPLYLYLQQHLGDLNAASSDPTPIPFSIAAGDLPVDIAARLERAGLIKSAETFINLIKYKRIGTKIQAGDFVLRKTMTMNEIADALQHGYAKLIKLTVLPGWRAEEIADYFAVMGLKNFSKNQFLQLVREGKFNHAFLKDRPKTASPSIEGFLLPETYIVPFDMSNEALITLMLDTFDQRMTPAMRQQAAAAKITLLEAVTLASIVQREAVVDSERPIVASVFWNRVKKKMFLQADSTAQYAIGYQAATKTWWKSPVTLEELTNADSPYNTYRNAGLPPAPICNPSLGTIAAALQPAQTDYLFFFSKGDGTHVFAKTYEEHLQNQAKYQK